MKRKIRTVLCIVAVSAAFVSLISCRKNVPEGKLITADGTVTDFSTQSPFAGVKVYLFGAHFSMFSISYTDGPFDSVVTDASGHFSFRYRAEGDSKDYAMTLRSATFYNNNAALTINDSWSPYEVPFNYAYHLSDIHFTVFKTLPLQLHLTVTDITHDSLLVEVRSDSIFNNSFLLYGKPSVDTVLQARFLPRSTNYIEYYSFGNDTIINGLGYRRKLIDTLPPDSRDSVQIEKHINSTSDFPLHTY